MVGMMCVLKTPTLTFVSFLQWAFNFTKYGYLGRTKKYQPENF